MHCPFCRHDETKVIDSRLVGDGMQVRRRRECLNCEERYTTYEVPELSMPRIIKRDGRRKPFDEDSLRKGFMKAMEKRPVSIETIEASIDRVKHKLRATGEREVSSQTVGECVMQELQALDKVAYVRFASVYRSFEDLKAFRDEIQRLENQPKPAKEKV